LSAIAFILTFQTSSNNRPFLPNSEKRVSKSELKLWCIDSANYHANLKESISGIKTSINHLIHISLFSFILLLFIAAWLEPKLHLFSDNGMQDTLIFLSTVVVVFYLGFLGTIGFDPNKIIRWLFFSVVPTSRFNNVDLTDANFSFAQLTNSDFRESVLTPG